MLFNGANVSENVTHLGGYGHATCFRDIATITRDHEQVEPST